MISQQKFFICFFKLGLHSICNWLNSFASIIIILFNLFNKKQFVIKFYFLLISFKYISHLFGSLFSRQNKMHPLSTYFPLTFTFTAMTYLAEQTGPFTALANAWMIYCRAVFRPPADAVSTVHLCGNRGMPLAASSVSLRVSKA